MTDPRNRPDDRPISGSRPLEDEIQSLQGGVMPPSQDAVLDPDELEAERIPTRTELDGGAVTIPDREFASGTPDGSIGTLDMNRDDALRDGETDDPIVAIEEGLTWVAPSDPPTLPSDDPQGIDVAAGSGARAASEPIDDDHRSGEDLAESEMNGRVREAIRADAATAELADRLEIAVVGSTAVLRGTVDDLDDGDRLAEVIERVAGIQAVRDETEVAGLD